MQLEGRPPERGGRVVIWSGPNPPGCFAYLHAPPPMVGLTDHLTTRLGRVPSGSIGWDIPSGGQKHGQVVCTLREQHSIGNRIQIEKESDQQLMVSIRNFHMPPDTEETAAANGWSSQNMQQHLLLITRDEAHKNATTTCDAVRLFSSHA